LSLFGELKAVSRKEYQEL